jgi:flagellar biosynthesis chaperone FliJ
MSARRSPLRTVLRVAELRERGARAAVAAATAAQRAADHEAEQRRQMVTPLNVALDGARMVAAHEQSTMRADAASAAAGVAREKAAERVDALTHWADAAARRSSMEELLARSLAERETARVAAEQRAMDDRGVRKGGAA